MVTDRWDYLSTGAFQTPQPHKMHRDDKIRINVGGTRFVTTATTIANAGRDSMLYSLLDENWQPKHQELTGNGEYEVFIDRNPDYFAVLLDLLRTGELRIPHGIPQRALVREAVYYGVDQHVKSALWESPLDGNRVECRSTVRVGSMADDPVAIRASPNGGCGVAQGFMIHLYDWWLEQLKPVNLDYMNVNDFRFLATNPSRLLVCTMDRGEIGGMGCFNSSTGKLEQRFRLDSGKNFLSLTCESSDTEIFASCVRGVKGIGIWDQETAKNVGFFPCAEGGSKLQWLPGSKLLLFASMFPQSDHCFLRLHDLRQKLRKVWEWTDSEMVRNEPVIMDAAGIESRNMVCVVEQYDNLGFIDTRVGSSSGVHWSHMYQKLKRSELEEHSYSKLRTNGSDNLQILSTRGNAVLVHSCSASFLSCYPLPITTAKLVGSRGTGRSIADIDVGGDRLFVLHSDESVFDVWETPAHCGVGSV